MVEGLVVPYNPSLETETQLQEAASPRALRSSLLQR